MSFSLITLCIMFFIFTGIAVAIVWDLYRDLHGKNIRPPLLIVFEVLLTGFCCLMSFAIAEYLVKYTSGN